MDYTVHALTASVSVGAWELGKMVFGLATKRLGDKHDAKRKLVRDDLGAADDKITACLEHAFEYYGMGCEPKRRVELSRMIRHSVQQLSIAVRGANLGLAEIGLGQIGNDKIISFRQALTFQLDSMPPVEMEPDDPRITAIYRSGHHLAMAFRKFRYAAT